MRPLLFRMATEMAKLRESEISRCAICGQPVVWAHRPDPDTGAPSTAWHPPLVFAGFSNTVVNGAVFKVPVYDTHTCDPVEIKKFEAERRHREQVRRDAAVRRATEPPTPERQHHIELLAFMAEVVADVPCVRCEALVTGDCRDLRKRRDGLVRPKKWPHDERVLQFLTAHPERALPEAPPSGAQDRAAIPSASEQT